MYKFKKWYKNLKFRNKVSLICLLASLIPVITLGSFCYIQIRHLLIARENQVLHESLQQAVSNLDYKINSYFTAMNSIVWDDDINRAVTSEYNNNYEMYLAYRDMIDPFFMNIRFLHNEINRITIYSNNKINPHGNILRPLSDIEHSNWYSNILKTASPKLVVSPVDKAFGVISQLNISNSKYKNILYMDLDYERNFDFLSTLFHDSYGIIIVDENKTLVYSFQLFSHNDSYALSLDELLSKLKDNTLKQDYVYEKIDLSSYKWTAYLYRPVSTVSAAANQISIIVSIVIIICILILFFSIYFLSKIVVRPLEKLEKNMEQIEAGNLSITVTSSSTDEIGRLIQRFGNMVQQLQHLINEVYKSKIAQQQYEMKALQAQINPHFFYNSLSLINSKAIMSEQEDISEMAQLLSTFYRTTLNKGKNLISVKDEWENTISYTKIQCMMHSDSFDVYYDIDEEILGCTMINLILQPLVENAVNHGLDHKETPGKGILTISGKQAGNNLIFVVSDNGCGIAPEILKTILTTETKGYGIHNVHQRIQLYYGQEYGLSYESTLMKGTTVTINIPKKIV